MSNLQAAIGLAQIERADELIAGNAACFSIMPKPSESPRHHESRAARYRQWLLDANIVVDKSNDFERQRLLNAFQRQNIDGRVFFWPLSSLSMFEKVAGTRAPTACLSGRLTYPHTMKSLKAIYFGSLR